MNVKGVATATLGLGAAAEALRFTPKRALRLPVVGAMWTIHVLAALLVATRSPKLPLPKALRRLGLPLLGAGGALAFYSAVAEHSREGRGASPDAGSFPPLADLLSLDTGALSSIETPLRDGTYRASRHPALIGYSAFLIGLALATRSLRLIVSLPLWLAAAVGQSALREEALRRRYDWYDDYARSTPMLIPTRESVQAASDDLRARFRPREPVSD